MEAIDVWRTAAEMMRQFGDDASLTAALRADALLARGDFDGFHLRKLVVAAIAESERKAPKSGEILN